MGQCLLRLTVNFFLLRFLKSLKCSITFNYLSLGKHNSYFCLVYLSIFCSFACKFFPFNFFLFNFIVLLSSSVFCNQFFIYLFLFYLFNYTGASSLT